MNSRSMAGWIGFAGILLLVVGAIDFMQGLIALFEDEYYVVTQSGFLVVDLTAWGWIMMIWGVLLVLGGLGLLSAQGWARWFTIVVVCLELHRPARLPRQQPVPDLVVDRGGAEHDRSLRADGALEREHVRPSGRPLTITRTEAVARCGARRPLLEPVGSARAGNVRAMAPSRVSR